MKLALIGCGRIAAIHIESIIRYTLDSAQPIEIVALIDTNLLMLKDLKEHTICPVKYLVN